MGNPWGEQVYGQDSGGSSLDNGQGGGYDNGQAQGGNNNGFNPNFQPLLNDLPQDLHEKVLPHLQQWDKGVQDRFEKLQSGYAPWKSVLSSGATPEMVNNGLSLMNLLDTNPEALYRALADNYKFGQQQDQGTGQGQGQPNQQAPVDDIPDYVRDIQSKYGQMEQNFTTLAQHVLEQRQQEANAREDAALANEFKSAHSKLGDFDDDWVKAKCLANLNLTVEQAASQYKDWERGMLARHGARPLISGSSGGGVPGQGNIDVTKLNGAQTRGLAVDMIRQMRASNND